MKAIWKNTVLAESDETIIIENNHYFPPHAINQEHFEASDKQTYCSWKGKASYYNLIVQGEINQHAAWYYPNPKAAAREIKGYVAFWKGVKVEG